MTRSKTHSSEIDKKFNWRFQQAIWTLFITTGTLSARLKSCRGAFKNNKLRRTQIIPLILRMRKEIAHVLYR